MPKLVQSKNVSRFNNRIISSIIKSSDGGFLYLKIPGNYTPEVAIVYELLYAVNPERAANITHFLSRYLYESVYYNFHNLTINVPYPWTSTEYQNEILEYGEGLDSYYLDQNLQELFGIGEGKAPNVARIADGLEYVYSHRLPGASPAALIIVGDDDSMVNDPFTTKYLNMLKNQTTFVTMAASFGGDFSKLVDDPKYYFKVDATDPSNQRLVASQIAKAIANI